jgi:hypothetical protein
MKQFRYTRLAGGGYRYGAPPGLHDDCVMAAAIGWNYATSPVPWLEVV